MLQLGGHATLPWATLLLDAMNITIRAEKIANLKYQFKEQVYKRLRTRLGQKGSLNPGGNGKPPHGLLGLLL